MQDRPVVSISCITFNHERFIGDALDSFLMQKTSFPFEILIHDDASSDHTPEIIRSYVKRYPDVIKPIYQQENQYSQGVHVGMFNRSRAVGDYIAMCEGDDFWTDPYKLQNQVDILESNPDHSMCITAVEKVHESHSDREIHIRAADGDRSFTLEDLLKRNMVHTASVLFRRELLGELPNDLLNAFNFDYVMWVEMAKRGPIYFLDRPTAVYRVHEGGIYSSLSSADKIKSSLETRYIILNHLQDRHKKLLLETIYHTQKRLIEVLMMNEQFSEAEEVARLNHAIMRDAGITGVRNRFSNYLKRHISHPLSRVIYRVFGSSYPASGLEPER